MKKLLLSLLTLCGCPLQASKSNPSAEYSTNNRTEMIPQLQAENKETSQWSQRIANSIKSIFQKKQTPTYSARYTPQAKQDDEEDASGTFTFKPQQPMVPELDKQNRPTSATKTYLKKKLPNVKLPRLKNPFRTPKPIIDNPILSFDSATAADGFAQDSSHNVNDVSLSNPGGSTATKSQITKPSQQTLYSRLKTGAKKLFSKNPPVVATKSNIEVIFNPMFGVPYEIKTTHPQQRVTIKTNPTIQLVDKELTPPNNEDPKNTIIPNNLELENSNKKSIVDLPTIQKADIKINPSVDTAHLDDTEPHIVETTFPTINFSTSVQHHLLTEPINPTSSEESTTSLAQPLSAEELQQYDKTADSASADLQGLNNKSSLTMKLNLLADKHNPTQNDLKDLNKLSQDINDARQSLIKQVTSKITRIVAPTFHGLLPKKSKPSSNLDDKNVSNPAEMPKITVHLPKINKPMKYFPYPTTQEIEQENLLASESEMQLHPQEADSTLNPVLDNTSEDKLSSTINEQPPISEKPSDTPQQQPTPPDKGPLLNEDNETVMEKLISDTSSVQQDRRAALLKSLADTPTPKTGIKKPPSSQKLSNDQKDLYINTIYDAQDDLNDLNDLKTIPNKTAFTRQLSALEKILQPTQGDLTQLETIIRQMKSAQQS